MTMKYMKIKKEIDLNLPPGVPYKLYFAYKRLSSMKYGNTLLSL